MKTDTEILNWLEKHAWIDRGNCDRRSEDLYQITVPTGHDVWKGGKELPLRKAIEKAMKANSQIV